MTHESMSREALALKRQALQQQLGLQRQLITATLSRGAAGNDAYPRSMTMRSSSRRLSGPTDSSLAA